MIYTVKPCKPCLSVNPHMSISCEQVNQRVGYTYELTSFYFIFRGLKSEKKTKTKKKLYSNQLGQILTNNKPTTTTTTKVLDKSLGWTFLLYGSSFENPQSSHNTHKEEEVTPAGRENCNNGKHCTMAAVLKY